MSIPFNKVAIYLVILISPPSAQGNRWILTLVDYVTRWLEAVPVSGIDTERIAEALLRMFSRVGFSQEILRDRVTIYIYSYAGNI